LASFFPSFLDWIETVPSSIMKNLSPYSPSVMMVVPASKVVGARASAAFRISSSVRVLRMGTSCEKIK